MFSFCSSLSRNYLPCCHSSTVNCPVPTKDLICNAVVLVQPSLHPTWEERLLEFFYRWGTFVPFSRDSPSSYYEASQACTAEQPLAGKSGHGRNLGYGTVPFYCSSPRNDHALLLLARRHLIFSSRHRPLTSTCRWVQACLSVAQLVHSAITCLMACL